MQLSKFISNLNPNMKVINGLRQGKCIEYDAFGSIMYNYRNNLIHDECIIWYPNGSIGLKCNYSNGKKHGQFIDYNANGSIDITCNYSNDKLHGEYIAYYPDGLIYHKYNYFNGKMIQG